jgi:CRP/FNR family transcriptional regulator, cyclic AMP receptor protein
MAAFENPEELASLPLFAGISLDSLRRLNERLGRLNIPTGRVLMSAEQPGEMAYVILSGTLRVQLTNADGEEITLALLGPGEIVGEMALIDDDVRSASVVALESISLLWIDRQTFAWARHEVPQLVDNLIRILARRLRHTNAEYLALATVDVLGRVARQLLLLAEKYGVDEPGGTRIQLRLTQDDIAHLVAATRVRVNQAISRLKSDGVISVDVHQYIIHDPDALGVYV